MQRGREMSLTRSGWLVLVCLLLSACTGSAPPASALAFTFHTESDTGVPLEGVLITLDGRPLGESNSDGLFQTRVKGRAGERLQVDYRCPAGHRRLGEATTLQLQHFEAVSDSTAGVIETTLRCPPDRRIAAFVIRSDSGAGLPVWLGDEKVGTIGASGVGHFTTRGSPGTAFSVRVDSTSRPGLRPQSPVHRFTLSDRDEVFVITQEFKFKTKPKRKRKRRPRIIKIE